MQYLLMKGLFSHQPFCILCCFSRLVTHTDFKKAQYNKYMENLFDRGIMIAACTLILDLFFAITGMEWNSRVDFTSQKFQKRDSKALLS